MTRILAVALTIAAWMSSCDSNQPRMKSNEHVAAADAFTSRYARSRLARWNVQAHAAGTDCGVFFVQTKIVMEDSMVEALHYGGGAYDVYRGGVQQYSHDRAFRGVAYRDGSGRMWTYGDVTTGEALAACR
ncbi:MAG: hypothetical protein DMF56_23580 [Acidobacteria bacterium]|nr:MAG: hypothetical protein DMF56_23580 [Acidobacteriota bacterium]